MLSLIPWFGKWKPAAIPPTACTGGRAFDQLLTKLFQLDRERIDVHCYASWAELRQLLASLDRPRHPARQSVLLVIDRPYRGDLACLIARRYPGLQLILAPLDTALSGSLSSADLALHCRSLGWLQIAVERDLSEAVLGAQRSLESGDRLALCWPA